MLIASDREVYHARKHFFDALDDSYAFRTLAGASQGHEYAVRNKCWSNMSQFPFRESKKVGSRDGQRIRPSGRYSQCRVRGGAGTADHRGTVLHNGTSVRTRNTFERCGPKLRLLANLVERDDSTLVSARYMGVRPRRHGPSCLSTNSLKAATSSASALLPTAPNRHGCNLHALTVHLKIQFERE